MPLDPELVTETRSWLGRVTQDLRAADHEFTAIPPLLDDIVFHAQPCGADARSLIVSSLSRPSDLSSSARRSIRLKLKIDDARRQGWDLFA